MTLSLIPPVWKEAPFLRLLIPFSAGIFLQQSVDIPRDLVLIILLALAICFLFLHSLRPYFKFKYNWVTGIFINFLLLGTGYLVCETADGRNRKDSIIKLYSPGETVQLILEEPLIEKTRSYKATASIRYISKSDSLSKASGKVNIYFSKDININPLEYGSSIIVSKTLEKITSSGNPGAFDYQLYCQRQGIYYSVFLSSKDYELLPANRGNKLRRFLFETRHKVLDILSRYIQSGKELGLAKALLIGYKDELDKNLVQAYSNTGVVHIIAISGLHLGIVYWLLNLLLTPLQKIIRSRLATTLLMLAGLWLFSLLAGAGPSVLRSAFMFSMIALGNSLSKNSNVYNNLAFSAFALLCYNPYWLWDVGFQLSYAAVLSIVLFFKPIYNWFFFENKMVDFAWKLIAVTLAAQILTLPISIYHFHQLPVYFIISNLVAVPLSSIILIAEIFLCCFSFLPSIAFELGSLISLMIQLLNTYVQNINQLPLSVWGELQVSPFQTLFLFSLIGGMATWLMNKAKPGLWIGLASLFCFLLIRTNSVVASNDQLKLIVYNIQNASCIDFISGRKFLSICSAETSNDPGIRQFSLQPSRILNRAEEHQQLYGFMKHESIISFGGKMILLLNETSSVPIEQAPIDIIILTKNPRIHLPSLLNKFSPKQIIADASNKIYNVLQWQAEAKLHQVPFHNVRAQGAYVDNLRQLSEL